nr:GAF domain-containing SpoIIE family protein phosphatase [uncultured Sphaerochaeta sp.]
MKRLSSSHLLNLLTSYTTMSAGFSSEETLRKIMNEAAVLLNCEAASIFLLEEKSNELQMKVATNLKPEETKKISVPFGKGIVGYAVEHRELVNTKKTTDDKRFYKKIDEITGVKTVSCLTVPLIADDKTIGAAQVINKKNNKNFDEEDELLFSEFGKLAALTLGKVIMHEQIIQKEKMETDLEIAAHIQNNLLPSSSLVEKDYEFTGYYKPAKFVGGDYFDFFKIADNEIFFTIGDVTGKGAHASLLMASVEAFLSASFQYRHSLTDAVFKLNNFFNRKTPDGIFVTMFFAILNTEARELTYINAGHTAPVILRKNGKFETLEATDVVLGVLENWKYEVNYRSLAPDDIFLAFTDGVTEAQNLSYEMFGQERLREEMLKYKSNPTDLLKYLPLEIEEFCQPNKQSDDISVLLVTGKKNT